VFPEEGIDRPRAGSGAASESDVGSEGSKIDVDSSREQAVVDLLPQLKESRMPVPHAAPDRSGPSAGREYAQVFQGQNERLNLNRLEMPGDRPLIVGFRVAEKPKGEMKVFSGCPIDTPYRFLEFCQQRSMSIWNVDCDKKTVSRLPVGHSERLRFPNERSKRNTGSDPSGSLDSALPKLGFGPPGRIYSHVTQRVTE